ncbi:hypothetical protein [Mesorhizobium mediterraneum]|uniref:hypothetical protein n=1 Tax=Mesorhizobium mediterraneum TaxID=43617 RepID=UPI00177A7B52|nr:hypothetical protein [Mesorhizobium mediterraneum]
MSPLSNRVDPARFGDLSAQARRSTSTRSDIPADHVSFMRKAADHGLFEGISCASIRLGIGLAAQDDDAVLNIRSCIPPQVFAFVRASDFSR